ncbi:MAG: HAMP domain-containing sensor histidine kinase [Eubacteriales bacterium]
MAKKEKQKKKIFLKFKSITTTMFFFSLATIAFVLLIGYVLTGVIAPRVYSNSVMNEIQNNLQNTLSYYEITLEDVKENPNIIIIASDSSPLYNPADNSIVVSTAPGIVTVNSLFNALAMSHGAVIEIVDESGETVYETPDWFKENVKGLRGNNSSPKYLKSNFFLEEFIEDNLWIYRTTTLSMEQDYTMNVRMDLRSFNQNIYIFNRIFFYMLTLGGIFAVLFSVMLSLIVTKPLKELKRIASAMENMDFSIRYSKNRGDEIGELGNTLNHMMDRLGTTITQLKAELQKEKRTDKLRKEFVAQVSHELKTPVAIVSNYTEALLDGVADTKQEQQDYLNTIESECRKMAHIINDLLDLSQMEAGTFKINKSKFQLKDLIEDIVVRYDNLTKGKVQFIKDIKIGSIALHGDELRIEQAVSNLLSNAVKHTAQDGYIKLTVTDEKSMVNIQVENEGEPIDDELMLHIWDSFTKGSDEKGAGLGLSITKSIVDVHGGEYYVQNLDNAVLFGIRLPK